MSYLLGLKYIVKFLRHQIGYWYWFVVEPFWQSLTVGWKINRFAFIFLGLAMLALFVPQLSNASASTSIIAVSETQKLSVGEELQFDVLAKPAHKGELVYTVKFELVYPADLLKFISFEFNKNWVALAKPGYDQLDLSGKEAKLTKTGGYPGGFDTEMPMGRAVFKAISAGKADIGITNNSFVLDGGNLDVFDKGNMESIVIIGTTTPAITPVAQEIPKQTENLAERKIKTDLPPAKSPAPNQPEVQKDTLAISLSQQRSTSTAEFAGETAQKVASSTKEIVDIDEEVEKKSVLGSQFAFLLTSGFYPILFGAVALLAALVYMRYRKRKVREL